jgi:hypothetical protein
MKNFVLLLLILLSTISGFSQVGINSDGSNPDNSSMLDIKSTSKGILIPRMSQSERAAISSPANGLMVYSKKKMQILVFYFTLKRCRQGRIAEI